MKTMLCASFLSPLLFEARLLAQSNGSTEFRVNADHEKFIYDIIIMIININIIMITISVPCRLPDADTPPAARACAAGRQRNASLGQQ